LVEGGASLEVAWVTVRVRAWEMVGVKAWVKVAWVKVMERA
jgi:hypothetical protein